MTEISAERLRELLDYDPETGHFVWLETRGRVKAGQRAGCKGYMGYIVIRVDGVLYKGHRLAWLHHYGVWPEGDIDHRNRAQANNRIENLRPATDSQNLGNSKRPITNTSGFKGVGFRRDMKTRPWQARIRKDGRQFHLGFFPAPEEAHAAYIDAARHHFGKFARAF